MVVGILAGVVLLGGIAVAKSNEMKDAPIETAAQAAAKKRKLEEARQSGRHCQGYKGEARNLSGLVKQQLRNPDSFEHVSTTLEAAVGGVHRATIVYRATNGFGAIDTYSATGEVRQEDCSARVAAFG